ncbi:Fpg/Nei family DNA glycosylase [Psychromicrobium xiongbiense]|uniref:Fpg/Nei family DNA glycosylase n=1 Tax=Psychromicrobium xiongbiense TaxID=3051184 RepID=UPI0025537D97|nr:DNA-formamidopyrimidine glycosylase family protein [Psychromicrobium sp. YIM S02556]
MPELPELVGLSSFLQEQLRGQLLTSLQISSFTALKTAQPAPQDAQSRPVQAVRRAGKFVDLVLGASPTDDVGLHVVFHLAKAGWVKFRLEDNSGQSASPLKPGGYLTARLRFEAATLDLTEAGTRRSLAIYVVRSPQDIPGVATLGPDPLSPSFTLDLLRGILGTRRAQVKGVLRDQRLIAGIGNAYSDEILHAARLSPFAPSNGLSEEQLQTLFDCIGSVLAEAIAGASGKPASELKDAKRSGMRVHARTGEACPVCGDTVREVSFADRSLQYCPTCQTGGKLLADRRMSRLLK